MFNKELKQTIVDLEYKYQQLDRRYWELWDLHCKLTHHLGVTFVHEPEKRHYVKRFTEEKQ